MVGFTLRPRWTQEFLTCWRVRSKIGIYVWIRQQCPLQNSVKLFSVWVWGLGTLWRKDVGGERECKERCLDAKEKLKRTKGSYIMNSFIICTLHLHLVPRSKNEWSYTSTPHYASMVWCSVKAQGQLYLYLLPPSIDTVIKWRDVIGETCSTYWGNEKCI
jgi:hypothetical protein